MNSNAFVRAAFGALALSLASAFALSPAQAEVRPRQGGGHAVHGGGHGGHGGHAHFRGRRGGGYYGSGPWGVYDGFSGPCPPLPFDILLGVCY